MQDIRSGKIGHSGDTRYDITDIVLRAGIGISFDNGKRFTSPPRRVFQRAVRRP